jgi:hypothetical protein
MILYLRLWDELTLIYLLYLLLETYPFITIQRKINSGFKYLVLLLYPLFGLSNAVMRVLSFVVWAYKRFVTGEMRRKTEKDRKWTPPVQA